ncbi:metallophosphoesterase family protein [Flagellimonas myxillae]|uniref:metallophosphoesterase family protein n=1 Tax=Flagellimonas myxillae TaxID=2942214 RepID=UPI00201F20BF|nr:metallophosphoesterase [Muricauda myxillae]MCL6268225.1 metallophosphoesterase [Muricauda myxillae]
MKRRNLLKSLGLGVGATVLGTNKLRAATETNTKSVKRVLRIAHITDVHIRPEHNAPSRFKQCIESITKMEVDFFLNGGDTIYAADYDHITRERVKVQWDIWHKSRELFSEYEVYSCLGNHNMWWAAPDKSDGMYGKEFAVKQLGMPNRYFSFTKNGWTFFVLDSNNKNAGSLDQEQMDWFKGELAALPEKAPVLIMTHYPILSVGPEQGGNHTDCKELTKLFYEHKDKPIHCVSGHIHLLEKTVYNNVKYYCNGAVSGFWWEDGNADSAHKSWVSQTPPGYAILDLYEDGSLMNSYYSYEV